MIVCRVQLSTAFEARKSTAAFIRLNTVSLYKEQRGSVIDFIQENLTTKVMTLLFFSLSRGEER